MPIPQSRWSTIAALTTLAILCLVLRSDALPAPPAHLSLRMRSLPRRTLWVWERPEDLHAIDPTTTAIAWLDRTILLGQEVVSVPRRQPIAYPNSAVRIAVVRIEALAGASLDTAQQQRVVALLLQSAAQPGIAALQPGHPGFSTGPTPPGACRKLGRKPGVKPDEKPNLVLTVVLVPLFLPTELIPAPLESCPGAWPWAGLTRSAP